MLVLNITRNVVRRYSCLNNNALKCAAATATTTTRTTNMQIISENKLLKTNVHRVGNLCCWRQKPRYYGSDSGQTQQERIYYGPLTPRLKMVKVFSLSTSLAGLAAQPILMEQGMKMGGTGLAVFLCGFAGFFTFVTPFMLHFITKKYVTEIHYDAAKDEYTATTISFILQNIQTRFRISDVKVPEVPGMFTSFLVNKKALFVDASFFSDPEHYARIMGFDKPLDLKLELQETSIPHIKTDKEQQIK